MSMATEPVPAIETTKRVVRTLQEEIANSITHGVGLLLSVAGLVYLLLRASVWDDGWRLTGCAIFGVSLVALYAGSTVYHGVQHARWKPFFRTVDHACIYLLIAGSYTPFTLTWLRHDPAGWWLTIGVWSLAVAGVTFKLICGPKFETLSTAAYVAMGWLAILAIKPIWSHVPAGGLAWIVAGGMAYTLGVFFYTRDHRPFNHTIWHLFVLGGSICHYCAVVFYVA